MKQLSKLKITHRILIIFTIVLSGLALISTFFPGDFSLLGTLKGLADLAVHDAAAFTALAEQAKAEIAKL